MDDLKYFLDFTGLSSYDAKIKQYIKENGSDVTDNLIDLIGASSLGENEKTLLVRIAELEAGLGDVTQLEGEIKNVVSAILGEATRAKDAEKALADRLDVIEGDGEGSVAKALVDAKAYADGKDAAIAAAKSAADAAQADIDALEAKVGTVEDGKTVIGLIDEAKQAAIDAASYDDTQVKADIKANADAIAILNGDTSTTGSVAKTVADAKSALETEISKKADSTTVSAIDSRVATIEGDYLKAADKTALQSQITANKDAIDTLNGEGAGSVKKQVADAVAGIVNGAPEAYDTLVEISDWISSHASDASAMNTQILANKSAIEAEVTRATAKENALEAELNKFTAISEEQIASLFSA